MFSQVWINNRNSSTPHFRTGRIGRDNAIARHGIHGKYWVYSVNVVGSQLLEGRNSIYLKQATGKTPFAGVMYDYIRLEAPSQQEYQLLDLLLPKKITRFLAIYFCRIYIYGVEWQMSRLFLFFLVTFCVTFTVQFILTSTCLEFVFFCGVK